MSNCDVFTSHLGGIFESRLGGRPQKLLLKNHKTHWLRRFEQLQGSLYLRILRALEEAIKTGELQPGDQIPPQRTVAEILGVDFTTVTRAYAAARERGLVEGAVGRGTFITAAPEPDAALVKLQMNLPPPPQGVSLPQLLRETTQSILDRTDMTALMAHPQPAGTLGQRIAGATWLEPTLGKVSPERILVSGGVQVGLAAVLATFMAPGDVIVVESLSHPALANVAKLQRLRVVACPADEDGLIPEELARICAEEGAKAVFCIPTLHPATTVTMSVQRRQAIAAVCRAADILILEDDVYGRIPDVPTPAISTFAPERSFYVTGLVKTLVDMRHGFVVAPDAAMAERVALIFRSFDIYPSPLTSAVLTTWIREETIEPLLTAVRAETRQRRALASAIFPHADGPADAYHIWIRLPADCDNAALNQAARQRGLVIATADLMASGPDYPNGVRVALGPAPTQAALLTALQTLKPLLAAAGA